MGLESSLFDLSQLSRINNDQNQNEYRTYTILPPPPFDYQQHEQDHIDEIYQRWPHLDDDIWCKLIIMERNRRIGKAYARVPIVTIDGSHELSYSGYKLALNGFDNPDRDDETEECRKRIGKGVKIKMDNFGNILIKRMSKAGVYVKEWINPAPGISGGSSNSTNGSSGAGVGRSMPSRKELIKAASMVGSSHHKTSSSLMNCGLGTPSSSGGSSMESPNDSAICDDVLAINGRLDQDKIYVMFDIKKFQANIDQELCRAYPDRRKLEQQCFSIVGLTRDSDDILNLPCWLMVINIVAIEMLNERLPMRQHEPHFVRIFEQSNYQAGSSDRHHSQQMANKEEDPYSLPANVSSSDMRSSINDYASSSAKNISHTNYAGQLPGCYMDSARMAPPPSRSYASKNLHPNSSRNLTQDQANGDAIHRSRQQQIGRAKQNLDGPTSRPPGASRFSNKDNSERYNNSSSIYSPGHMLNFHSAADHSVPPKLPPRDFVGKKNQRSKSSSSIGYDDLKFDPDESIYSTGLTGEKATNYEMLTPTKGSANQRKAKRNRFLDSLRAPLELARSNRSASVMDVSVATQNSNAIETSDPSQNQGKKIAKSKSGGGFTRAKKLSSFLGVGSKSKSSASEDSNYVQLGDGSSSSTKQSTTTTATKSKQKKQQLEVDSVVDSNEEIDDSHHQAMANSLSSPDASYNDLDIPTPDYETDENIYALDDGYARSGAPSSRTTSKSQPVNKHQNKTATSARTRQFSTSNNNNNNNELASELSSMKKPKDDLYYSGFRAHVPNRQLHGSSTIARSDHQIPMTGRSDDLIAPNNRYLMRTNRMHAAKMSTGQDLIYGSTLGLRQQQQQQPSMTGSRYRSASMQRYYSSSGPSIASKSNQRLAPPGQMYDVENPYTMRGLGSIMSAGVGMPLDDLGQNSHYGVSTAASCIGGTSRRRSLSKQLPLGRLGGQYPGNYQDIGRSSSGIYGVNSGSSSSEYADFHPHVRKVNSSGYLNSVFKGHHHQASSKSQLNSNQCNQLDGPTSNDVTTALGKSTTINGNHCDGSKLSRTTQVRNYASRVSKADAQALGGSGNEAQDCRQQEATAQGLINGPAYRSYDSSNDSDPSYTNSSDGLDIYDQIGASQMTSPAAASHNNVQHNGKHHEQFLDHSRLAHPVHIGEWEDLYDR